MASSSPMGAIVRRPGTTLRRCVVGAASAAAANTQQQAAPRFYGSMPTRSQMVREMEKTSRQSAKKIEVDTMAQMQKRANDEYFKHGGGPLFPGTFVPVPLFQNPNGPASFLVYQWYRLKSFGLEFLSLLNFKLQSMPNWTTRPQWKIGRGRIAPTGKVMYADMLTAFAEGDKEAINSLCVAGFAKKLTAAIDRRNPAEKTVFEVLSFNKPLFYPRVVAHQIHQVNTYDKEMMTEQAVVAIASTQKVSKHSASTGQLITGSTKLQDKVEYVVLSRQVSNKTFQSTKWRIWGTVPVTSIEGYRQEQRWLKDEQSKRVGWDDAAKK